MCTGVSIEQWRVAVGVMAAMAPNCKRRYKIRKATMRSIVLGKLLTVLVLLMLLMSNHTDSEPEKAYRGVRENEEGSHGCFVFNTCLGAFKPRCETRALIICTRDRA